MAKLLLLNGPNLNLLGTREPGTYGSTSLADITSRLTELAKGAGHELISLQSNHEGVLIDAIQEAGRNQTAYILFNPAAFTHTSVALRDALLAVKVPFIEIHLSNVHARESFRHQSYFSDIAAGAVIGFGPLGYELALIAAAQRLSAAG